MNPTAWKNGGTASTRSSGVIGIAARICMTFVRHARWVSITPLGSPVVPLEYGSRASASWSIRSRGGLGGLRQQLGERDRAVRARFRAPRSVLATPARLHGLPGDRQDRGHRQEEAGVGVAELGRDLVWRVERVDPGDDAARGHRAVAGDQPLWRVRRHDRERVSLAAARGRRARRPPVSRRRLARA